VTNYFSSSVKYLYEQVRTVIAAKENTICFTLHLISYSQIKMLPSYS